MEFPIKFNTDNLIIPNGDVINFDEGKHFANQYYIKTNPKNITFDDCSDAFHKSILESSAELRRRLYLMAIYDFDFVINCINSKYFYLVKEPVKLGRHFDDFHWEEMIKFYYLGLADYRIRISCIVEDINNKNYEGMQEIRKIYPDFFKNIRLKMNEHHEEYRKLYKMITSLIDECTEQEIVLKAKNINIYRSEYKLVTEEKKEKIRSLIDSDFFIDTNIKKIEFNNTEFIRYLELVDKQGDKCETEEQYEDIVATTDIVDRIIKVNKSKIKTYRKKKRS